MNAVLRGTFISVQTLLRKPEKSGINNINDHVKELEK